MAFNAIANVIIQVGKPVVKTLWDLVQGNFNDHETRLADVELGASKIEIWNDVVHVRNTSTSLTGFDFFRAPANFTLLTAKVGIFTKGAASGTLEYNILKSPDRDRTNGVTVFTTKPSLLMSTASDFDDSTNAVFDINEQAVLSGETLILDLTSLPAQLTSFFIFLQGEFN